MLLRTLLVFLVVALSTVNGAEWRLWYRQPASSWVEALPLGNGRLGAMVFGGIDFERLQLNEDTLWGGGPYDPTHDDALPALPRVRALLAAGDYRGAQSQAAKLMGRPLKQMPYQTVGDLFLTFGGGDAATDYERELNLNEAVARTRFRIGNDQYEREVFISAVDQVMVVRMRCSRPGRIAFVLGAQTPQRASITCEGRDLVMHGRGGDAQGVEGAVKYTMRARVIPTGGTVNMEGGRVQVAGADSVVILISAATNFRSYRDLSVDAAAVALQTLDRAAARPVDEIWRAHVADHQRLFNRVDVDLGTSPAAALPTDVRIAASSRQRDPQLAALYLQYARYLLITSSRPGTQPANLQGIWNDSLNPPWQSKYTININTQMNYWPAEPGNLAECHEPLFQLIREISETGAKTARRHYGAGGWVAHHNTDIWRATAPVDGAYWGMWMMGGAWLCQHLWQHYLYNPDRAFLEQAYPLMKGSAEFFLDTLIVDPKTGWWVTSPSISPENEHHPKVTIAEGPTMDMQILRDLFDSCIRASALLERDADFRARLVAVRAKLVPNQIGKAGQLMEWKEDWDLDVPEINHRHVSQLYGLYPSTQIHRLDTPELAAAARRTVEIRGDFATGWGIGWRINVWARLGDGGRAHQVLYRLLQPDRSYPNLFDAHAPFQIDGNFGAAAGIMEMLIQSRVLPTEPAETGRLPLEVELLPALPSAWAHGRIAGLRTMGGAEADLEWSGGRLGRVTLRSVAGTTLTLRYAGKRVAAVVPAGGRLIFDGQLNPIAQTLPP